MSVAVIEVLVPLIQFEPPSPEYSMVQWGKVRSMVVSHSSETLLASISTVSEYDRSLSMATGSGGGGSATPSILTVTASAGEIEWIAVILTLGFGQAQSLARSCGDGHDMTAMAIRAESLLTER